MINDVHHAWIGSASEGLRRAELYFNIPKEQNKMDKIHKLASKDAEVWAAAEMAYGEGAGTRRKLAIAEIDQKMATMPGYMEAFNKAYEGLDMTKFAKGAIKERKAADRAIKASKNLRALKSGKINNLSTGIFLVVGGYIVAKQTGYDKVIAAEVKKGVAAGKKYAKDLKASRQAQKAQQTVHNITQHISVPPPEDPEQEWQPEFPKPEDPK